jgi:hypothetical protein
MNCSCLPVGSCANPEKLQRFVAEREEASGILRRLGKVVTWCVGCLATRNTVKAGTESFL